MLTLTNLLENGKKTVRVRVLKEKKFSVECDKDIFTLGLNHILRSRLIHTDKAYTRDEIREIIKRKYGHDKVSKGKVDNVISKSILLINALNGQIGNKSLNAKRNIDIKEAYDMAQSEENGTADIGKATLVDMLNKEFEFYIQQKIA